MDEGADLFLPMFQLARLGLEKAPLGNLFFSYVFIGLDWAWFGRSSFSMFRGKSGDFDVQAIHFRRAGTITLTLYPGWPHQPKGR